MYEIVYFSLDLRKDDDFSPLIGIRFIPNKKNKLFSLLVQKYEIVWSERYKCYILPDTIILDNKQLKKYLKIIDLALKTIKEKKEISVELLERENMQSYYTKESLVNYLSRYINGTSSENSIILDPAAGIGNLTDKLIIPKKNIYLVEPNKKSASILKEKGYKNVINSTFEEYLKKGNLPNFSHIIMNPPFKDRLDLFFFNKCFEILQEHGYIAAITSENSIYEELQPLKYIFDIDYPSSIKANNFNGISDLLQEYIDNLHNTEFCFMNNTNSFHNTSAKAYSILAQKNRKKQDSNLVKLSKNI